MIAVKYNPTRWVCQFPQERCDGFFYVYGTKRPCPLFPKCQAAVVQNTPLEYRYPQQSENQRVLTLSDPQRYLVHAKRSCDLRRTFLTGDESPDRKYYYRNKDIMLARSREKYRQRSLKKAGLGSMPLPCGSDCRNCPYDNGCHYDQEDDIPAKRPGPSALLPELELRQMVKDGLTIPEISARTGIKRKTLISRCYRLNIRPKYAIRVSARHLHKYSDELAEEVPF